MRSVALIIVVVGAALAAQAPALATIECAIGPAVGHVCDNYNHYIYWGYTASEQCEATFTIERRCCPNGPWITLEEAWKDNTYLDESADECRNFTFQYRVTLNCPGCNMNGGSLVSTCLNCIE